jgi:hypothetical protein
MKLPVLPQIYSGDIRGRSYTTALSVKLNGEKLRADLIWPGTGTKSKKVPVPENLYVYYREKSWMSKTLLIQWVNDVLAKRTRKLKEEERSANP